MNLVYRQDNKNIEYNNFKNSNLPMIYKTRDKNGNYKTNYDEIYKQGFGGRLGIFAIEEYKDLLQPEKSSTKLVYFFGKNMYSPISEEITNYGISGSLFTDNLYSKDYFVDDKFYNLDLFESYFQIIANAFNFEMNYRNEFTFYNSENNQKIKFVDWSIRDATGKNNYNSVKLKIHDKTNNFNEFFPSTILVNQAYASKNKVSLGDTINFETGETSLKWNVSGIASDYNEIYPLIYDTDIIPNSKNDMIIYANRHFFQNKNNIPDNYIADNSKLLFNYHGNNLEKDIDSLNASLFTNSYSIRGDSKEFFRIKNNDSYIKYLREDMLFDLIKYLEIFLFTMCFILLILTLISILVIITKNIKLNLQKIGVLKALGTSNIIISLSFSLNALTPVLIGAIIAYPFIYFGQWFILFNLTPYSSFIFYSITLFLIFGLFLFLVSVLYSFLVLNKNTISLINQNIKSKNKVKHSVKLNKSFTTTMSKAFFQNSLSKTISLFVTLFISSLLLSFIVSTPFAVKNVEDNYFKRLNYDNGSRYVHGNTNNPLNYITTYDYSEELINQNKLLYEKSLLPDFYAYQNENPKNINSMDLKSNVGSSHNTYNSELSNLFGFNILTLLSKSFSINSLDNLTKIYLDENNKDQSELTGLLNLLIKDLLAKQLGINVANASDWKIALNMIYSSIMPPNMLENWKDENKKNNFTIDINSTSYNEQTDDLGTEYITNVNNKNVKLIGLDQYQKSFDIDNKNLVNNSAIISTKMAHNQNLSIGDKFNASTNYPVISFLNKNNDYVKIDTSWWKYKEENNTYSDIQSKDLTRFTYGYSDLGYGLLKPYYVDGQGKIQEYNYMQNIVLTIPKNQINFNDFEKLWNRKEIYECETIDNQEFVVIRPYDWRYEINDTIKSVYDIVIFGRTPTIWYEDAYKLENKDGNTFLKTTLANSNQEYLIVDKIDIYDQSLFLTNNQIANQNLNISSKYEEYNKTWFNAKYSLNESGNEYMERFGFRSTNELYTFNSFGNYWANQTENYDLLGLKKDFLDQLYFLILIFASIFIIIIVLSSIISISIISNLFIEQYKDIIKMFKIMGYSNLEIHLIFTKIIAPVCFILIAFGVLVPQLVFITVRITSLNLGIFIPFTFMAWLFIIQIAFIFCMVFVIYLLSYKYVTNQNNILIRES